MGKIIRFEFQVPNPEEAIEFYSNSLGWKFEKMPGPQDYWFIITGENDKPGIDGGLMKSPEGALGLPTLLRYLQLMIHNKGY